MSCTSAALAHHAGRRAGEVALVAGGRRTTYAQLDRRVHALAAGLRARGVGPGDVVGVLLGSRAEALEAQLAADRLGAAPLLVDRRLGPGTWGPALQVAGARLVLTTARGWDAIVRVVRPDVDVVLLGDPVRAGEDGLVDHDALVHEHRGAHVADHPVGPGDVHRLVRVPAPTGGGRTLAQTHAQCEAAWTSLVVELGLTAADRALVAGDLEDVGGADVPGTGVLRLGGSVVLLDEPEPDAIMRAVEAERVTVLRLAPMAAHRVAALDDLPRYDASRVRLVVLEGEGPPPDRLRRLRDAFPHAWLAPSRTPPDAAGAGTFLDADHVRRKAGSLGRPVLGLSVEVLDAHGQPVGPGVGGAIALRGAAVGGPDEQAVTGERGWLDADGFLFPGAPPPDATSTAA